MQSVTKTALLLIVFACFFLYTIRYVVKDHILKKRHYWMIGKEEFLEKYQNHSSFERSGLTWDLLEEIYNDFEKNHLEHYNEISAQLEAFLKEHVKARKVPVHSIKTRVKDAEHLIEKICRKCGSEQSKKYLGISKDNYRDIIHDLIGVRFLTVSKEEWEPVCDMLLDLFPDDITPDSGYYMAEPPKAYVRYGDRNIINGKIATETTHIGYRSQHYIVFFEGIYCEIQVRTLAEEAFGEFDHRVKYPYRQDNTFLKRYSSSVSQLLDSVDELISSCLTMGDAGWEKNAEYFNDTEYFGESNPNIFGRIKRKSVKVTPELLVGDKIDAKAYADRYFQRRYDN